MTVCTRLSLGQFIGKKDGTAHGGHLLEARICPTCEVVLVESPVHLQNLIASDSWLKHW
jgi:uncharacterized protein